MISVQQILAVLFVVAAVAAYRNEIVTFVKNSLTKVFGRTGNISISLRVVDDIVALTQLRDKLAAEDCPQGVEACTNLLRVIIEHQTPKKEGAV